MSTPANSATARTAAAGPSTNEAFILSVAPYWFTTMVSRGTETRLTVAAPTSTRASMRVSERETVSPLRASEPMMST